jgi:hypothetical protein
MFTRVSKPWPVFCAEPCRLRSTVAGGPEARAIDACAAVHQVVVVPADQQVIARAAHQGVVALLSIEDIVAAASIDAVVAGAGADLVVADRPDHGVVAAAAVDDVERHESSPPDATPPGANYVPIVTATSVFRHSQVSAKMWSPSDSRTRGISRLTTSLST